MALPKGSPDEFTIAVWHCSFPQPITCDEYSCVPDPMRIAGPSPAAWLMSTPQRRTPPVKLTIARLLVVQSDCREFFTVTGPKSDRSLEVPAVFEMAKKSCP